MLRVGMKNLAVLFACLLCAVFLLNCGEEASDIKVYTLKPSPPEPNSLHKYYIPKDLDDCFVELKKMLPPDILDDFKNTTLVDMDVKYHLGLGMWLRNNWGLWKGSRLAYYFKQKGFKHPDDMSHTILVSFWRHLNPKRSGPNDQHTYHQDFDKA